MNPIEARRWRESLDLARHAASGLCDDFGYVEPRAAAREAPPPRGALSAWRARARARRELARIPARDLEDAGLSVQAVEYELTQPFWRPLNLERK